MLLAGCQDTFHGRFQIRFNRNSPGPKLISVAGSFTGEDQHSPPRTERPGSINVSWPVADAPAFTGIDPQRPDRPLVQLGPRLAAATLVFGGVGAVIDPVDVDSLLGQLTHQFRLHPTKVILPQSTGCDAGLVGDDHPDKPGTFEPPECIRHAGEEADVPGVGTVADVLHQGTIAVEEDRRSPRWLSGHGRPAAVVSGSAGVESAGTAVLSGTWAGRSSGTTSTTVMSPTAPPAARTPITSMR